MHKTEKRAKESRMNLMYSYLCDRTLAITYARPVSMQCSCRFWEPVHVIRVELRIPNEFPLFSNIRALVPGAGTIAGQSMCRFRQAKESTEWNHAPSYRR